MVLGNFGRGVDKEETRMSTLYVSSDGKTYYTATQAEEKARARLTTTA